MALKDLVRYVGRCCAQKPNCHSLYELVAKHDWGTEDVLALLRSERLPPKKVMREMLRELGITPEYGGRAAEQVITCPFRTGTLDEP